MDVDVLIVGGGIAGVGIAERLSREARRRGKHLDILVVEMARSLGTGASGRLEGWYHSGALYSGFEDPTCFEGAIAGMCDLRRWYQDDDAFEARAACNLDRPGDAAMRDWFYHPIDYLLPRSTLGDASPTRQRRMVERLRAFDVPAAGAPRRHEHVRAGVRPADFEVLATMDRVMDARRILRDLVRCAWSRAVRFRTGTRVDALVETKHRVIAHLSGETGDPRQVRAGHVLICAGAGVCPGGALHDAAPADLRVDVRRSVMVVSGRAFSPLSFAHVGASADEDFSHLIHPTPDGGYSVIADSNSLGSEADERAGRAAAEALMCKAEHFFGPGIWRGRSSRWYACTKVEAVEGTDPHGRFLPWIRDGRVPNVLCVLPGKFSMFPTLAHVVTMRLHERGVFDIVASTRSSERDPRPARVEMGFARWLACRHESGRGASRRVQVTPGSMWDHDASTVRR